METGQISTRITELYNTYASAIFLKINSIISNRDDALDVLQVTFERLYVKAHRDATNQPFTKLLQDDAQIHAYLYRIAINESYRFVQKVHSYHEIKAPEAYSFSDSFDLLDEHIAQEQLQAIEHYIKHEAETRERELFYLVYFEELKQKEIADILGVTTRYVRTLHKKLVRALQQCVQTQTRNTP